MPTYLITSLLANSMSNHPTYVPHHLRFFWSFYQWLALVRVNKIQILSLFVLSDLWPAKDGLRRPLPGGQKLHFCLAAFHKNCNILRILRQIKLQIKLKMEFWECRIADSISKVAILVTFGKGFIFCILVPTYFFLDLKSSLKRQKSVITFML